MDHRCYTCLVKSFDKLLESHPFPEETKEAHMKDFLRFLGADNGNMLPADVSRRNHQKIREMLQNDDPYREIKIQSNNGLLAQYGHWKEKVSQSDNPFETALRLAIGGNIIDYAANPEFDVDETVEKVLNSDFAINHSQLLREELENAETVLYLGDNAGEIVMDKLFLETLNHPGVVYAVRGRPVINDVTLEDAKSVGIDQHARVISNGADAPSTLLHLVSDEFLDVYRQADVIISKGQGNLEGLLGNREKSIFYLLMVKCPLIGDKLGVQKGDFVVANNHLMKN